MHNEVCGGEDGGEAASSLLRLQLSCDMCNEFEVFNELLNSLKSINKTQ